VLASLHESTYIENAGLKVALCEPSALLSLTAAPPPSGTR
jgi:hypothetical protein